MQHHGSKVQTVVCGRATRSRVVRSRPLPPSHDRTPQANTATEPGLCRHPPNSRSGRRGLPTSPLPWRSPLEVGPVAHAVMATLFSTFSWNHAVLGPLGSTLSEHPRGACRRTGAVSGSRHDSTSGWPSGPCLHRVLFRLAIASSISPVWPCLLPTRPFLPTSSSAEPSRSSPAYKL